ncbi:YkgJ family cysteine cluster protein [Luteimonas cucumeris]|nr:YkgJ family cysteine cluster protein [Luteimonas cucumeris]
MEQARAAIDPTEDDRRIDTSVSCSRCDAVCCRLTVVVMPEDNVPEHLVDRTSQGLSVMARGEEGWCVAVDPLHLRCTIYDQRPGICRKFAMGSAYCRDERKKYREENARAIPLALY